MSLEENVWEIISGVASGNIFPYRLPENTAYPAVDFIYFEGAPIRSQNGSFRNPRLRFSIWADTFDDMIGVFRNLISLLDYHKGAFSSLFEGVQDIPDPETQLFHRVVDFYVWGN